MKKHIYFSRQIDQESNEKKTVITIYGDKKGYEYFIDVLEKANASNENLHLAIDPLSYSMDVVVLPAASFNRYPIVKFLERPVMKNKDRLTMELIVCGNKLGYNYLKSCFLKAFSKDFFSGWHQHLDKYTEWLIFSNIDIIIEIPIEDWNKKNRDKDVKYYKKIPYSKDENVLPSAAFTSEQSYQEFDSKGIDFYIW